MTASTAEHEALAAALLDAQTRGDHDARCLGTECPVAAELADLAGDVTARLHAAGYVIAGREQAETRQVVVRTVGRLATHGFLTTGQDQQAWFIDWLAAPTDDHAFLQGDAHDGGGTG